VQEVVPVKKQQPLGSTSTQAPRVKPRRVVTGRKVKPDSSYSRYVQQGAGAERGGHKWNEHEYYMKAKNDMQKHHHDKITKMMKDWASARQRVQEMKVKDPKGSERLNKEITSRFQKMYEAEEMEGVMEKKQLTALHQQRVQAELNEKKQRSLDLYVETLDDDSNDASSILKALKQYVKTMQKDRMHTVNRHRHLEESDPEEAESSRPQMAERLRGIDQQLTDALALLNRVPRIKSKILQEIQDYLDSYHSIDRSVALILLAQSASNAKNTQTTSTTTTPAPTRYVEEDDDDDDEDDAEEDDGDEDDEDEDWSVKKYDSKSETSSDSVENDNTDDEEDDEDEFDDDDDEDDIDSDSEEHSDERVNDKVPTQTTTLPTTITTRQPTTKSAAPIEIKSGLNYHDDEKQTEDHDEEIAIDYMNAKAGVDSRHEARVVANVGKDSMALEQQAFIRRDLSHGFSGAVPLGIAVGGLTVFIVIIVGVITMRRRQRRGQRPLRPLGSLDLDAPMGSPEERHVASMQMNGYENPTYKYFEQNCNA